MLRFVIRAFFRELNRPHHPPRKAAPATPPKRTAPRPQPRRVSDEATPHCQRLHHNTPAQTSVPAQWKKPDHIPTRLTGKCWVEDGDTIIIKGYAIRLAWIDAPELDHPYGKASKWAMHRLCKGQTIIAHVSDEMSYKRVVATCYLPDGRDLAAELVKQGLAIDWPKFSGGKYAAFETPDARQKMRRAALKQQGRYVPGT